jgi:MtaA/CmuA family methyltransferase
MSKYCSMTSLERAMTTIRHGIPDRVPVDLHNFLTAAAYSGQRISEVLQDGELMAETQLQFWRDFGHDILLVENGVVAEAQACGCGVLYPDDGPPRVVEYVLADGLERVDELEVPDPEIAFPMCEVLRAVRILRRELDDRVFIMGRADQGPVALAAALRGYEQFIVDLQEGAQPALIHRVLDYCRRVQVRYALALKAAGAHGTSTGEAGVDFIGPRLYRQFAHPHDCRLVQDIQSPDFPLALHICGDATLILADMVATGAQILELDYKTDMHTAKALMQGRATFLGPVNPELIWAGTPAEVEAAAREALAILAPGGGFILGPGCALGATTPPDNIHALIEAAYKYGIYNPDGSLKAGLN